MKQDADLKRGGIVTVGPNSGRLRTPPAKPPATPPTSPEDGVGLTDERRRQGEMFLQAIAKAEGKTDGAALAKALNLSDGRGLSPYAKAARAMIAERITNHKQADKVLAKARDVKKGSLWTLDVARVKEAGLLP